MFAFTEEIFKEKFHFLCNALTQVDDQVKIKLILQLIKGISRVLQKLFKYFNRTAILASVVLPAAGVFLIIFTLALNDSEFVLVAFGSPP